MFSSPRPEAPDHWFGRITLNPNFYKSIKVINFSQVCPECYKKNSNITSCEHIKIKKSRLKESNISELREILGSSLESELLGMTQTSSYAAFDSKKIERLFSKKCIIEFNPDDVEYSVVCIDPSYGGENNTAIAFGYMDKYDNHILTWLTAHNPKTYNEFTNFLYGTIRRYREHYDELLNKPIYIVYEQGSRWDASVFKNEMEDMGEESIYFRNIYFIVDHYKKRKTDERSHNVPGITMTRDRLNNMVSFFARGIEQKKLFISQNFSSWSPDNTSPSKELEETKTELLEFRHYEENSNKKYDPNKKRPKNNSGKSYRKNDDRAIVWQMLTLFLELLKYGIEYTPQLKHKKIKKGVFVIEDIIE